MSFLDMIPEEVHSVALMGHVHPDGDCLGALTAVYHYLTENRSDLQVTVFTKEVIDPLMFLLEGVTVSETEEGDFDMAISVDAADKARIPVGISIFDRAKYTLVVDHHETNGGFGQKNVIEPFASSTCEVLARIFDMEKVSKSCAISLYTGMTHDSGVFRYSCTSPETLRIAAQLLEKDIPFSQIIEDSFISVSYKEMRVMGECMANSVIDDEIPVLVSYCPLEMQEKFGVTSKDLGGIVASLNETREAKVTIFMYQFDDGSWKGSLRSKCDVNVAHLAGHFGGGGHAKAAGFSVSESPENAVQWIKDQIKETLS